MKFLLKKAKTSPLLGDERGLSTVEYIILLVLIATACVALWGEFGTVVKDRLQTSKTTIETELP